MIDGLVLKAFGTLLAAVGAIALILFFLKKYAAGHKSGVNGPGLKVVGKLSLQPKNQIFIVEAGSRTLLIGVSEKGITLLADLTKDRQRRAELENLADEAARKIMSAGANPKSEKELRDALSFKSFLKSAFTGSKN